MISVTLRQFILNTLYHGYLQSDAGQPIQRTTLDDIQKAVRHEPLEGDPPLPPVTPGRWQVKAPVPGYDAADPYYGPTDPNIMVRADWQAFQQQPEIRERKDIYSSRASNHPEAQKIGDNSITLDFDAYVAGGGTLSPWLEKVS